MRAARRVTGDVHHVSSCSVAAVASWDVTFCLAAASWVGENERVRVNGGLPAVESSPPCWRPRLLVFILLGTGLFLDTLVVSITCADVVKSGGGHIGTAVRLLLRSDDGKHRKHSSGSAGVLFVDLQGPQAVGAFDTCGFCG